MANFNLEDYEPVHERIPKFYEKYPDGRIITELAETADLSTAVFKAILYKNAEEQEKGLSLATGWASEIAGNGYVNKTSHLENCETSAIGRALANIGIHGDKRPSREEMQKVEKGEQKPQPQKTNQPQKQEIPAGDMKFFMESLSKANDMTELMKLWNQHLKFAWTVAQEEEIKAKFGIRKNELKGVV